LVRELHNLRRELANIKGKDEGTEGFKVLSDKEFDELAEEDPAEALKYQHGLRKHERDQHSKEAKQRATQQQYYQDRVMIRQSIDRMEKTVPGLHEEGNPINDQLTQFAIDNGFDPRYLQAMTTPGTLILPPGAKNAVLLGDGAASLVEMIYKLHSNTNVLPKSQGKPSGPGKIGTRDIPEGGLTEADYAKMSSTEREKILGG
jgi:hypothetical protein